MAWDGAANLCPKRFSPNMKLHHASMASNENSMEILPGQNSEQIERRTSNVQYRWRYAWSIWKQANRRIWRVDPFAQRWRLRRVLLSLFIKLTEYSIRCWTFDVQCSFFWLTPGMKLSKRNGTQKNSAVSWPDVVGCESRLLVIVYPWQFGGMSTCKV